MTVRVTFLGTGDPFGTGGRLQAATLIEHDGHRLLLDCGMTTSLGLARAGVDPATLDGVVVTHWHGDHFGGLAALAVEALIRSRSGELALTRDHPLIVAGPPGTDARLLTLLDTFRWLLPGGPPDDPLGAVLTHRPLDADTPVQIGPFNIQAAPVVHTPEALGVRVEVAGRIIAYSGDTAWTDALLTLSDGADLFICQTFTFEAPSQTMLSYRHLQAERDRLTCKRLMLTHLGREIEARLSEVEEEVAADGQTVTL